MYQCFLCSRVVYDTLRPYKLPDYHFAIPTFIQTENSKKGFLCGFFDAEGSVNKVTRSIEVGSKHRENLVQIGKLLKEFSIGFHIYRNGNTGWRLIIGKKGSVQRYKEIIGFGLERKKVLLDALY
jgi:intein/homing endonuclease